MAVRISLRPMLAERVGINDTIEVTRNSRSISNRGVLDKVRKYKPAVQWSVMEGKPA